MAASPNSPPEPDQQGGGSARLGGRLRRWLTQPIVLTAGAVTLLVGTAGVVGGYIYIRQNLPDWVASRLSDILQRPVTVGPVQSLNLGRARLGPLTIPATETDADEAAIEQITADFNLWPVLFQRRLPVTLTLSQAQLYVEQAEDGSWIAPLNIPEGELPVSLDLDLNLEPAAIAVKPQGFTTPLQAQAEGTGRYTSDLDAPAAVQYDLNLAVANSPIQVAGVTQLQTGETEAELTIDMLSLPAIAAQIANLPLQIAAGDLNTQIDVAVQDASQLDETKASGLVQLRDLEVEAAGLPEPVRAGVSATVQDQALQVQSAQASLGDLTVDLAGQVSLADGYALEILVQPVDLQAALTAFDVEVPVAVQGRVGSIMQVTGPLEEPVLRGIFQADETTQIDQVA
ncbi:MAG: hypothetical protein AAGF24_14995, partial [Cyanobacteria bacterium P01_H01_bin.121]